MKLNSRSLSLARAAYQSRVTTVNALIAAGTLAAAPSFAAGAGITAIDASIITEGNYSEADTTYAVGWRPEQGLQALLDFIMAPRQEARRFSYKKTVNKAGFLSDTTEDLRAARGEFKQIIEPGSTEENDRTENRGLMILVDNDELAAKGGSQYYVNMLMDRLMLNKARRGYAILLGLANNTDKVWSSSGTPDADCRAAIRAAAAESGIEPNRGLIGGGAWVLREAALDAQTAAGGFQSPRDPEGLARKLMLDGVLVPKARYASSESVRSEVVGSVALFFSAYERPSLQDPSNVVDFWSPAQGGGRFGVYVWQQGSKMTGIAVEHYEKIVAASELGVEKLTVTAS